MKEKNSKWEKELVLWCYKSRLKKRFMKFNLGQIYIDGEIKNGEVVIQFEKLAYNFKVSDRMLYRYMSYLLSLGAFERVSRGKYQASEKFIIFLHKNPTFVKNILYQEDEKSVDDILKENDNNIS